MYSQQYDDTNVTGKLKPSNDLAEDGDITYCAALVTLTQGQVTIHVNNFTDQPYILEVHRHFFCPGTRPINSVTTWHLLQDNPENAAYYASSMIKSAETDEDKDNYWFPTPEETGDTQTYTPIQQRILKELQNLKIWNNSTLRLTLSPENHSWHTSTGQTRLSIHPKMPKLKNCLSNSTTSLHDTASI